MKDELLELSKNLEIHDKVDFIGFNSDVITYYSKAKATILSSIYEGFPNVLIESISLGTPVVSLIVKVARTKLLKMELMDT